MQNARTAVNSALSRDNPDSKIVIMNNKRLTAGNQVTTSGIVSLYNKGFVPKKGGLVPNT